MPLPKTGLLSFFVCDEASDEPGAPGYCETVGVYHFDVDRSALAPAVIPSVVRRSVDGQARNEAYPSCEITFRARLKLPPPSHPVMATLGLSENDSRRYDSEVFTLPTHHHQVLGYRDRLYDAEQPIDTLLLLQLTSDDVAEMQWGDVDDVYFYIKRDALEAGDFSGVFAYLGD
jgi:hypothetical protein